jgi:glycogen synthase
MRIALFAWETLHSIAVGGVAVHATELAAALERRGHEVHVFTRWDWGRIEDERIDGVWYHRCKFHLNRNFVEEINDMCRSFVHRFEGVQRVSGNFDIVHAHDWLASNAMVWIKQGQGKRGVLTMHSTEYGRCGNNFYNSTSERVRHHENHGTFCADRVIAVSYSLKRELQWIYHLPDWKVPVIYNGINAGQFNGVVDQGEVKKRYGLHPFDPMILFVGRLTCQKGPDILLQAMRHVLKHHHDAKVLFVGDGDLRWHLDRMSWQCGINYACRFVGAKSGDELKDIYRASDIVVVPSRNEPFGIVILEAWGAGKPVVVTYSGGPSEFVWHNVTGLKVHANEGELAWGICELLRNREHGKWMGQMGRQAAETAFSWDTIAQQTENVYYSI